MSETYPTETIKEIVAYWAGYARKIGMAIRLPNVDTDKYASSWDAGYNDALEDLRTGIPNRLLGYDAKPMNAYPGKIICSFPIGTDTECDFIYVHDQDMAYYDLAHEYWRWVEPPDEIWYNRWQLWDWKRRDWGR